MSFVSDYIFSRAHFIFVVLHTIRYFNTASSAHEKTYEQCIKILFQVIVETQNYNNVLLMPVLMLRYILP